MQSVPITTDVVSSNLIRASLLRDRRGRNRMVVGFTTTYVISDPDAVSSNLDQGEVYNIM